MNARCLYFGVTWQKWDDRRELGHFWHDRTGRHLYEESVPNHLIWQIDGRFAPKLPSEPQGVCALHHVLGWTVVAWWDRSGDGRGKSNAAFILQGEHSFDAVLEAAREVYPGVFAVLPYPLTLYETMATA